MYENSFDFYNIYNNIIIIISNIHFHHMENENHMKYRNTASELILQMEDCDEINVFEELLFRDRAAEDKMLELIEHLRNAENTDVIVERILENLGKRDDKLIEEAKKCINWIKSGKYSKSDDFVSMMILIRKIRMLSKNNPNIKYCKDCSVLGETDDMLLQAIASMVMETFEKLLLCGDMVNLGMDEGIDREKLQSMILGLAILAVALEAEGYQIPRKIKTT